MILKIKLVLILFVLQSCNLLIAQDYFYEHFGVNDGLPSSEVYDVYQDKQGYMWFATDRGLSRYNGYEFENFTTKDGLPSNVVLKFFPHDGKVWCHSIYPQSLFYFDEEFEGFKLYKNNAVLQSNLRSFALIKSLLIDSLNNIHIGGNKIIGEIIISENGNVKILHDEIEINVDKRRIIYLVDHISGKEFTFQSRNLAPIKGLPYLIFNYYQNVSAVRLGNGEEIVFSSAEKISMLNSSTFERKILEIQNESLITKALGKDKFIVGFLNGGAIIYDSNGNRMQSFLEDESVTNFYRDTEGGYWFSTLTSGVFYIKDPSLKHYYHSEPKGNYVNSLAKNKNNELFLGCSHGDVLKNNNGKFEYVHDSELTMHSIVESNLQSEHINFYSDYYFNKGDSKVYTRYFTKIAEETNDKVLAATVEGFIYFDISKIAGTTKRPDTILYETTRINDVCSFEGNVFLGTVEGFVKYEKGEFKNINNASQLLNIRIEDIDKTNEDLYLATHGAGVVIYGDSIFNIAQKDGLLSDIINEIHFENDTSLWVCTNKGLNQIRFKEDKEFEIYGISYENGLLSNEIEDVEIIQDTIWLATKKGLCAFPKSSMTKDLSFKQSYLNITGFHVNGEPQKLKPNLKFKHDKNKITFNVQAINFAHTKSLVYRHRLIGHDSKWTSTQSRNIDYANLRPNSYKFEVQTCFVNGQCTDELKQFSFTIKPPFWKTWWFKLLWLLSIFGLIYTFFKVKIFTYNKDITRELLRLIVKKIRKKDNFIIIRESGKDIKLNTNEILYIQSSGNYIDIITEKGTHTIREKLSTFMQGVPYPLEFIRIHRSYIVRIDKVQAKSKNEVELADVTLPVSKKYISDLRKILIK